MQQVQCIVGRHKMDTLGISIDNLIASNVQIENGVFKRVEGALIVGSEFSNPTHGDTMMEQ